MNSLFENLQISQDTNAEKVQISDNYYKFFVALASGDSRLVQLRFSAISELVITEDLKQFYTNGHIIFNNTLDTIENCEVITQDVRGVPQKAFEPYVFRGDGRDLLIVNITPQVYSETPYAKKQDERLKQFSLNYVFSIYDYEDIITRDTTTKLKKLFLRDYSYQLLTERNSFYSTGFLKKGNSNTERQIYTGEAIRSLLQTTLSQTSFLTQKFASDWDFGSSKIFYSNSAGFKAIDDLNYLLDNHVSSVENDFSPCLLSKSRDNVWSLTPVTTMFKSVYYKGNTSFGNLGGSGITENFILAKPNTGDKPPIENPSFNPQYSLFANNFADYSVIDDYHFSNMAVDDSQTSLITTAVHSYDFSKGAFTIDTRENSIAKNLAVYNKNFVLGMKGIKNKTPYSNLVVNTTRTSNLNIENRFNPNPDSKSRLNSGRNRTILASLFLNNSIGFRARGNTFRRPGSFFTVARTDNQSFNEYDNKIFGSYLTLKTVHTFKNGQYNNYMLGSKTYTADKNPVSNKIL